MIAQGVVLSQVQRFEVSHLLYKEFVTKLVLGWLALYEGSYVDATAH